jgi:hypothetical protein
VGVPQGRALCRDWRAAFRAFSKSKRRQARIASAALAAPPLLAYNGYCLRRAPFISHCGARCTIKRGDRLSRVITAGFEPTDDPFRDN